jgi:hypothetical protein
MGRQRTTPEQAAAKLTKRRVELLMEAGARHRAAREEMAASDDELRKQLEAAIAQGASYRDLGVLLDMPFQTLHQYVKPYPRRAAA